MSMKAIFSNRLYKHTIDPVFVMSMTHTLRVFNQAKHFRYQAEVREFRGVKAQSSVSIHQQLKQRYGLNDYYAASAVQQGQALLSAQKELKNMYMRNKKEQISAVKRIRKARLGLALFRLEVSRAFQFWIFISDTMKACIIHRKHFSPTLFATKPWGIRRISHIHHIKPFNNFFRYVFRYFTAPTNEFDVPILVFLFRVHSS